MIEHITLTPIHTARHSGEISQHVYVRVDCDGVTGHGEMSDLTDLPATMPDLADLEAVLNEVFVGLRETELVRLNHVLDGLLGGRNDPGIYTGNIRCGVDAAFHDAAARRLGISVTELFGGPTRTSIRSCYPLFRCMNDDDIDRLEARVEELLEHDFDCVRLYVGGDPDVDEEVVRRLHAKHGQRLTLQAYDLSNKLDRGPAVALLRRLLAIWEPMYVESVVPFGDLRGMAQVRNALNVPVSEHVGNVDEMLELWQADAIDVVNVAPTSVGSIREALYQFRLADQLGMRCILSTTQGTSLATALELQLGASVVNVDFPTVSIGPLLYQTDPCIEPIRYTGAMAHIPTGPGWGVEPDPEAVASCEAPLTWQGYGFVTDLPDHSDGSWRSRPSGGIPAAGMTKH